MKLTKHEMSFLLDFMAYCTTRKEVAILSSQHESTIAYTLIAEYSEKLLEYNNENLESYIKEHYLT